VPVDSATYDHFLLAEKRAKELGLSLPEVLDRAQLLLTVERRHYLQVQAIEDVTRRLDRQSPNKLMAHYHGRVDGTPAEMFLALQQWFEAVVRNYANKTLEDL
jgi:hypothetical protein